ncbi:hypothetical protein CC85DRAFT_293826 [Cutaneotrichosporon oleaginosum]|uniref:Uncharacterized protein n=1 Tax=Cutaneotrichosporon oleaginosum TaxID=879819 RepID=A0A0J0XEC9_9TREE|nr:uncharacterized protein CC85DRAFT_293826 [Cutaneotrichosporon oleaginosum]KLT39425.1 hypothetical protein CC85DRAFT_293826 [Cutaneotrichosporon oleaginosum]TXT08432.1 hypothetical protein COLE_05356 [Cutaneotrichosporon oleaginosum]
MRWERRRPRLLPKCPRLAAFLLASFVVVVVVVPVRLLLSFSILSSSSAPSPYSRLPPYASQSLLHTAPTRNHRRHRAGRNRPNGVIALLSLHSHPCPRLLPFQSTYPVRIPRRHFVSRRVGRRPEIDDFEKLSPLPPSTCRHHPPSAPSLPPPSNCNDYQIKSGKPEQLSSARFHISHLRTCPPHAPSSPPIFSSTASESAVAMRAHTKGLEALVTALSQPSFASPYSRPPTPSGSHSQLHQRLPRLRSRLPSTSTTTSNVLSSPQRDFRQYGGHEYFSGGKFLYEQKQREISKYTAIALRIKKSSTYDELNSAVLNKAHANLITMMRAIISDENHKIIEMDAQLAKNAAQCNALEFSIELTRQQVFNAERTFESITMPLFAAIAAFCPKSQQRTNLPFPLPVFHSLLSKTSHCRQPSSTSQQPDRRPTTLQSIIHIRPRCIPFSNSQKTWRS